MKILIIGEKPSIARKIVEGISLTEKINKIDGYWESESYIVSSCVGHLLVQMKPSEIDEKYKKWSFDNLPFYFDTIPLAKSKSAIDQLALLIKLINRNDVGEVVNACDADREGELIFRNLLEYIKPKNKIYSRMWIESVATPEVMKKQIDSRKPQELYNNLYESAKARAYADYFLGLNATVAMTVKNGQLFSLGRVITPTTRIVVDLERQIANFIPKPFFKVSCDTNSIKDFSYKNPKLEDNRFLDKKDAFDLINRVGKGPAIISKYEKKTEKEYAPKLFSLSDLQIECSKKYKYTAQNVLDACQSLYQEHGLTTYPRTSENQISKEMALECPNICKALSGYFTKELEAIFANNYKINSSCIAKKEVDSHEALTPTVKKVTKATIEVLSELERNVYFEIVKRFLANFYPPAEYSVVNIEITRNEELFIKKDKNLKTLGFYKILNGSVKPFTEIVLTEGDTLDIVDFKLNEGKTEPPKRLTEGALIKIMQSPLKFVSEKADKELLEETGGLGTEATRAGIIENMKSQGYIELKKTAIYATKKGMSLIDAIPGETIKSVPLTVEFEKKLKLIKEGKYNRKEFLKEIMATTEKFVNDVKDSNTSAMPQTSDEEICKCPNCDSSIVEGKLGYNCINWKNCKANIYFNTFERFGGKRVTKAQAKELFTLGKTKKPLDFVSKKSGKPYKAYVKYSFNKDEQYPNKTELEFSNDK